MAGKWTSAVSNKLLVGNYPARIWKNSEGEYHISERRTLPKPQGPLADWLEDLATYSKGLINPELETYDADEHTPYTEVMVSGLRLCNEKEVEILKSEGI